MTQTQDGTGSPQGRAAGGVKWVLVTGGAKRLGRAMCEAFAQAGWGVLVHHNASGADARALCADLQAQGLPARPVAGRLDSPAEVQALFDAACAVAGATPHSIVCNASLFEPDTGRELQVDLLMRQMQVNLAAPMQLGSLLARAHADQGAQAAVASVVHVLDQKVYNLNPDYFSYTLTKLALERAVALQAQALAPQVRVNAVSPGLLFLSGPQSEDNFDRASRVNLLQKPIAARDVAEAAVFLANSPACTGTILSVDNGQHLVPLGRDVMYAVDHIRPGVLPQSLA